MKGRGRERETHTDRERERLTERETYREDFYINTISPFLLFFVIIFLRERAKNE